MPDFRGMFDSAKEKISNVGRRNDQHEEELDEYEEFDDGYDDFEEYDEYDEYGDSSRGGRQFGNRGTVTTRDRRGSGPHLVSYDDARQSSRLPSNLTRDPLPSYGSGRGSRTMVDSSLPRSMTPEGTAEVSAAASRRRESGLDSLFASTSDAPQASDSDYEESERLLQSLPNLGGAGTGKSAPVGSFDPYDAYNGNGASTFSGSRRVTVMRPMSYGDVEGVAHALKAGDAVVLALGNTPSDLSKRILDFAFGVASALDATVESIGSKVFAITRGSGLTDAERLNLRTQGVI